MSDPPVKAVKGPKAVKKALPNAGKAPPPKVANEVPPLLCVPLFFCDFANGFAF